jgi:hypothetical protein
LLREQQLAVEDDVELAAIPLDRTGVDPRALRDLGRETRGPAVVAASDGAVEDLDGHAGHCIHAGVRAAPSAGRHAGGSLDA